MNFDDNSFPKNNEIYFTVFTEGSLAPELSHFSFKYSSSSVSPTIVHIIPKNESNITVDIDGPDYTITFKQFPIKETSYYIKAYYKNGFNKNEKIESIAISESPGEVTQINEPNFYQDNMLSFKMTTKKGISYIKVMARINIGEFKEFYSYIPYFANTDDIIDPIPPPSDESNSEKEKNIVLYISIGVGSAFIVIIIILIVFVALYKKKNTDLMKQVNKISFVQSGAQERESGDDLLLGKDD